MNFHGLGKTELDHIRIAASKLSGWIFAIILLSGTLLDFSYANSKIDNFAQLNKNPEPEITDDNSTKQHSPDIQDNDQEKTVNKSANKISVPESEEESYPAIMRDLSKLPFPVRRMRELILEASLSGDIEKLRPLIGYGEDVTMLSLGGIEEDPLNFLKSLSGDKDGHEILAILTEILESGYVLMDEGSENELYVWPYFFAWPLDKLNPAQKVELYRLVTYGDYEDMESFGAYIFYRLGITPRGRWRFFVAGD